MINRSRLYFVAALLLLLAGCASVPAPPTATPATPETAPPQGAMPQAAIPQEAIPQPSAEAIAIEPVPKSDMSGNKAIIALLDRAQIDSNAGNREAAGSSLERALRIEPRNAWLWLELAQLRLAQGQYAQATTLARKSISFAGRDRRLQALNWQVIGNARVAQGDSAGAEQAFKLATDFAKSAKLEIDHGF
jgi:predicted Zn-dependent protease